LKSNCKDHVPEKERRASAKWLRCPPYRCLAGSEGDADIVEPTSRNDPGESRIFPDFSARESVVIQWLLVAWIAFTCALPI